tara:strand:+ start:89 stop:391 length:303 start_codon:yes stop_codon:yes gene_type:complete
MRWIFLTAFLIFTFPSTNLSAQGNSCGNAKKIKTNMALHGNRPWFKGLSTRGHLTEIWVNHETNEFVAFVVYPDGRLCLVDMGNQAETTSLLNKTKGKKI